MMNRRYNKGFSILETSITLVVIAILVSGFGTALYSTSMEARKSTARNQLEALKKAIVGEPRTVPPGEKSLIRHGYIGDLGALPPALSAIETVGSQPDYLVDPLIQLGRGWRGPYVSPYVASGFIDPWGTAIIYDPTAGTSALTGTAIVATIRSSGPDATAMTADDHVVEIYKSESFSDVLGYVKDAGGATLAGIDVMLSYAVNGGLGTVSSLTDNDGLYTFTNIAHGVKVVQLSPKLSYQKGTGFTIGGNRNNVQFVVENLGKLQTSVTTINLTWVTAPPSDFKRLLVNGVQRYSGTAPSNTTLSTTTYNVAGTGVSQEPFRVDISNIQMTVPDAIIGTVGTGGTLKFDLEDFEEVGTTTDIDMTGVTFTVEFSDASKTVFSPVRK